VVDAAIYRVGADAALRWTAQTVGAPQTVLVSLPDGKDIDGVLAALQGRPHIALRTDAPHLTYRESPSVSMSLEQLDVDALAEPVLALGTVSFIGEVLDLLDVETSTAYSAPSSERAFQRSMAVHSRS
jgi:hypothetical protein